MQRQQWLALACVVLCTATAVSGRSLVEASSQKSGARSLQQASVDATASASSSSTSSGTTSTSASTPTPTTSASTSSAYTSSSTPASTSAATPAPTSSPTYTPAATSSPTYTPSSTTSPTSTPASTSGPTSTPASTSGPTPTSTSSPSSTPSATSYPSYSPLDTSYPFHTPTATTYPSTTPTASNPTASSTGSPQTAPTPSPSQYAATPTQSTAAQTQTTPAPAPSTTPAATAAATTAATPVATAAVNQYTNAGSTSTAAYIASSTSPSSTPAATTAATASTASSSASTAQSTVESGGGGPDYAGAYEHSFDSADVTATPSAGTEATPVQMTTATVATVVASAASLNPAVVYAQTANATARSFATGSGSYVEAGLSGAIAIHAIYSTDETVLFFERPHVNPANAEVVPNPYLTLGNGLTEIGSIYDIATQTFTPFHFSTNAFCAGHVAGPDGSVIIAGGDNLNLVPGFLENGLFDVRHFDFPGSISTPAEMGIARWYPTVVTLPDGTSLIAGGSTAEGGGYGSDSALNADSYQIFDVTSGSISAPANLPILTRTWPINLYPYLAVLPQTGSILVIAGAETDIYATTSTALAGIDSRYPAIPNLPVPVSYPQTATFALLTLEPATQYTPEVVVFGGTATDQATSSTPSSSSSYRINLGSTDPEWEVENMLYPRVMGDAVHLPDGTLFICNGGQVGIAGGVPLAAAASQGITTPVLYNPYLASGSRYTSLADSQIQRLYHSNAFLLTSGEVLIAGSEATLDYRVQIYTPAYLQSGAPQPTLSGAPTSVTYGQTFTVDFAGVDSITRVTMIRQSAVTHSIHMDLRQIALVIEDVSDGTVTVTSPPDATIAPPGNYLLFILYNGIPSVASWVSVA